MAKPTRTFSANVGQQSTGTAGPDQIEYDLDNLFAALDPAATNRDGQPGGIRTENMAAGSVTESILANGAGTDSKIGDRTVNQTQAPTGNTGLLTTILSWITNRIRAITGASNWYDAPATTLANAKAHMDAAAPHTGHETPAGAQAKADAVQTNLNNHKASGDHDGRYYTEAETNVLLAGKSNTGHTHTAADVGALVSVANVSNPGGNIEIIGGTGIIIAADDTSKRIVITATTEAVPGPHVHNEDEVVLLGAYDTIIASDLRGVLQETANILNETASSPDANGIYTVVDYKRTDGKLYLKSTLSNPDANGNYQTDTWKLYASDGTTIVKTVIFTLAYDADGKVTSKSGAVS